MTDKLIKVTNACTVRQYNRSFSDKHYTTQNKAGVEIPVLWLCYSPKLDAAYTVNHVGCLRMAVILHIDLHGLQQ